MIRQSRSNTAIENEISHLERKLKNMGAIIGHSPDLPKEMRLAFLRRVYAYEMDQGQSQDCAASHN